MGQDHPVGPGQPRGLELALERSDLMAQDEDLRVLSPVRSAEQRQPDAEHAAMPYEASCVAEFQDECAEEEGADGP